MALKDCLSLGLCKAANDNGIWRGAILTYEYTQHGIIIIFIVFFREASPHQNRWIFRKVPQLPCWTVVLHASLHTHYPLCDFPKIHPFWWGEASLIIFTINFIAIIIIKLTMGSAVAEYLHMNTRLGTNFVRFMQVEPDLHFPTILHGGSAQWNT